MLHLDQINERGHRPHIKTLPWQIKEAGDSPGWTRAVRNTSFFSLSGLWCWSEGGTEKVVNKCQREKEVLCQCSFSKLADCNDKNLYRLKHCYPKLVSESNIQATYHSPVWEAGSKHTLTRPSVFSQRHMNQTSKPTHGTEYSTGEVNYTSTEVGICQQQVWPDRGLLWFKFSVVPEDVSLSRHFSPPLL